MTLDAPVQTPLLEAKGLVRLALPVMTSQIGLMLLGLVDTLVAGWEGAVPMAGIALGNLWSFAFLIFGLGASMGFDPLLSQAFGAGKLGREGTVLARSWVVLTCLGLPLWALHHGAGWGLAAMGQPVEAVGLGADYAVVVGMSALPVLWFSWLKQGLQARGRMTPAVWALVVGNVANLGLDLWFVHGGWGLEALGPIGLAWSTLIVRMLLVGVLGWLGRDVVLAAWGQRGATRRRADGGRLWDAYAALLRIALPVGVQVSLEVWAFNAATLLMGRYGNEALAAHTAALNACSLAFMVPMGLGAAAATRVGNLVGRGLSWSTAGWVAIALGGLVMTTSGTLFALLPGPLARLYLPTEPGAVAIAVTLLPIAAFFQIFDGVQVVAFGVLRGAGDTAWPSAANVVGYWLVGIPLGWWLAGPGGWGPVGVWVGLSVALGVVGMLLVARVRYRSVRGAVVV